MFNMQLSLENTHHFFLSETCKFDMCLKPQATSHEASRDTLPGKQEGVAWPEWRLFIMVGVYSPTLYKNWGVEWESLFSQPLFHGMTEGFEHCSSGYIGKICSGLCSQMVYWRTIGVWMGLAYTCHVSCNLKTYGK